MHFSRHLDLASGAAKRTQYQPAGRGRTWGNKGFALIEITAGFTLTIVVALMTLTGTLQALSARRWTVMQVMTDAYMTQETALGNRYTFDDLLSSNSPWPTWPDYAQSTVSLGKTSTSSAVSATVRRYRESKTPSSNLTGLEVYSLTSILSYQVGDKTYTKTRHTVRSR